MQFDCLQIDQRSSTEFYSIIIGLYALGQILASPVFGWWSNRSKSILTASYFGLAFCFVGNALYFFAPLQQPNARFVILAARILVGVGECKLCFYFIVFFCVCLFKAFLNTQMHQTYNKYLQRTSVCFTATSRRRASSKIELAHSPHLRAAHRSASSSGRRCSCEWRRILDEKASENNRHFSCFRPIGPYGLPIYKKLHLNMYTASAIVSVRSS